jgi:hypothetical protein
LIKVPKTTVIEYYQRKPYSSRVLTKNYARVSQNKKVLLTIPLLREYYEGC